MPCACRALVSPMMSGRMLRVVEPRAPALLADECRRFVVEIRIGASPPAGESAAQACSAQQWRMRPEAGSESAPIVSVTPGAASSLAFRVIVLPPLPRESTWPLPMVSLVAELALPLMASVPPSSATGRAPVPSRFWPYGFRCHPPARFRPAAQ